MNFERPFTAPPTFNLREINVGHLHVELLAQPGAEALHAVDLQAVLRLVRQAAVARGIRRPCNAMEEEGMKEAELDWKSWDSPK